jgi:Zn-dependent peptidase ImmA (M78 family)
VTVRKAHALCQQYGLVPGQVTTPELLFVAEEEGILVYRSPRMHGMGVYVPEPMPVIILRLDAPARVLAHELAHALLPPEGEAGPRRVRGYSTEESYAEAFAEVLCGPSEPRRRLG